MHFVYILRSQTEPRKLYIGYAEDLSNRIREHNRGNSQYTRTNRPWKLEAYFAFGHKLVAINFEKYLKSGSGHAFLKKRFLPEISEIS